MNKIENSLLFQIVTHVLQIIKNIKLDTCRNFKYIEIQIQKTNRSFF